MPSFFSRPSPPGGRPPQTPGGATQERLIPFPLSARSTGEPEPLPRRRREGHDLERPSPGRRAARRRRADTPWLQRNALSVAAASVLVALLGLGFGLLQVINRP